MGTGYNPRIITDGLVFALDAANPRCYAGTGLTASSLVNSINLSLVSGVGYTTTNGGNFTFSGALQYMTTPASAFFNFGSGDCCIELVSFFNASTSSDNTYRMGFCFGTTGSTYLFLIKWRSGISNGVVVDYSVAGSRYTITTHTTVPSPNVANTITSPLYDVNNKWTHFIVQISSNIMTLYVNSVALGSVTLTARWNTNLDLGIGGGQGDYMSGNIPLLKVYNRALSAAEIRQLYNATKGRYGL
jgi:hypothetical protein